MRTWADSRVFEVTNGRFVEFRCTEVESGGTTALEKADRRVWVATRPSSLRIDRQKAVREIPIPGSCLSSRVFSILSDLSEEWKADARNAATFYTYPTNLPQQSEE